jgi:hypothetical protein
MVFKQLDLSSEYRTSDCMFSADKPNKLKDSYFSKLCNDRAVENLHIKFCRPKYSFRCQWQLNNIAVSVFPFYHGVVVFIDLWLLRKKNPIPHILIYGL